MDSRAKQRVTGAVILAALFVLLVPELLTGPKSPRTPAATAQDEEGLRSYTIDIDDRSANTTPALTPNPVPANAISAPVGTGDAAPPATAPAEATQAEQRTAAAEEPVRNASSTPQVAPAPAPTPATPARSASPQTTPAAAPAASRGNFVVQLGSFGSRDNADRLARDMSAKGFKAFVAPIRSGGRDLYRVRVGPTPDRASAEALAADLKRIGQSGSIVPIS